MAHSEETKRKIGTANRVALKGRRLSDEHKNNISQGGFRRWSNKSQRDHASIVMKEKWKDPSYVFSVLEPLKKVRETAQYKKKHRENTPRGERSGRWIADRTLLKDDHKDRGGQLHREWSKSVKNRDGWKCKIANGDCSGRLEAHHILGWRSHPELRYQVNNGITLCHFHHPRKRSEEERLSPYFKSLVELKTN